MKFLDCSNEVSEFELRQFRYAYFWTNTHEKVRKLLFPPIIGGNGITVVLLKGVQN